MERDLVILGGGPAGLTAAIYAARANLKPLVIEGNQAGGQLMLTTLVENFPGFPDGVLGPDLMAAMRTQAERAGAEFLTEDVAAADFSTRPLTIRTHTGRVITAAAIIVATGARAKMLGLPSEERLIGRGVSTCATCDGFFFRGRDVIVIGGGDAAMEEALYMANLARSVTVVHRRARLRASQIMQERAFRHPQIRFLWNTEVVEFLGEDKLNAARLRNALSGEVFEQPVDGAFIAIGHSPSVELFRGQLELDEKGYLVIGDQHTSSAEGVFVAGDVHDHRYRQAVTAAGFGAMAAIDAVRWLQQREATVPAEALVAAAA